MLSRCEFPEGPKSQIVFRQLQDCWLNSFELKSFAKRTATTLVTQEQWRTGCWSDLFGCSSSFHTDPKRSGMSANTRLALIQGTFKPGSGILAGPSKQARGENKSHSLISVIFLCPPAPLPPALLGRENIAADHASNGGQRDTPKSTETRARREEMAADPSRTVGSGGWVGGLMSRIFRPY